MARFWINAGKYFCNFYEINSSQVFLYCKNFGVDGIATIEMGHLPIQKRTISCSHALGRWHIQVPPTLKRLWLWGHSSCENLVPNRYTALWTSMTGEKGPWLSLIHETMLTDESFPPSDVSALTSFCQRVHSSLPRLAGLNSKGLWSPSPCFISCLRP